MRPSVFRRLMNLWPPFLFTGIRCTHISEDFRETEVELGLRWWNRNYVGVHFGGSLFAMTDPFYMLMVLKNLGKDWVVWDKGATIDYIAPGRGTVTARFRLDEARLDEIRAAGADGARVLPTFRCEITDTDGRLVATVDRTLYVRRKREASPASA